MLKKTSPPEPAWCLSGVNLFEHLTPKQMGALHRYVKTVKYGKGETIFLPGDPSEFVYFLHEGRVRLAYLDESGKRMTLALCKKGEPFGEMALAGEERREWVAEAVEDIELCVVHSDDLHRFSLDHPTLCVSITRTVAAQVQRLEHRLTDLMFKDVPTRLARLLVRLGDDYGVPTERGTQLDIRLTHRDLANLIGSTRETVTFILRRLTKQGLIVQQKRYFTLLDQEGIRDLAKLP